MRKRCSFNLEIEHPTIIKKYFQTLDQTNDFSMAFSNS